MNQITMNKKHSFIKLLSAIVCLVFALLISSVAAFFSITGLATIFSTAFLSVVIMGIALESGKLVATGWIHTNWHNNRVSFFIKTYLVIAIAALMLITGIGIYGYLSKAYLDQSIPSNSVNVEVDNLQQKISFDNQNISRLTNQQNQMNDQVNSLISQNHVYLSQQIKKEQDSDRRAIQAQLLQYQNDIIATNGKLAPLLIQKNDNDTKLGPIKYVANLIGWTNYDEAVRLIILIIMVAFDPLALVLLLASTISFGEFFDDRSVNPINVKENKNTEFSKTFVPSSTLVDAVKKVGEIKINDSSSDTLSLHDAVNIIKTQNQNDNKKSTEEMVRMIEQNPEFLQELITIVTEYNQKNQ